MIFFYQATMRKGNQKIRGKGATLSMVEEWVRKQEKCGFILIGKIESIC